MPIRGVSITITYTAWDTANQTPKAGDGANHTLVWVKDGVEAAVANTPTEKSNGEYALVLTDVEADCAFGVLSGSSSTTGVVIVPVRLAFIDKAGYKLAADGLDALDNSDVTAADVAAGLTAWQKLKWLFQRFFYLVVQDKTALQIKTHQADGTLVSTQSYTSSATENRVEKAQ